MCNIFSGHIVSEKSENFGKIYYITGVHHDKDRQKIPAKDLQYLIAWESEDLINFSMVYDCGQYPKYFEKTYVPLLRSWGENQNIQDLLWEMRNDKYWLIKVKVAERIENQDRLWEMRDDLDPCVRFKVAERIESQERLLEMNNDCSYDVRSLVKKRIKNNANEI